MTLNKYLSAIGWWALTLVTLIVLDDLTYGPFFWVLSQFAPVIAVSVAFSLYWVVQILLVREGTSEDPHRAAAWLLHRLDLHRKHDGVQQREESLRKRITGPLVALPLSLIVGGVIPALVLYRLHGDRSFVRKLSVATAAIYAAEFAYLHAYLPTLVV